MNTTDSRLLLELQKYEINGARPFALDPIPLAQEILGICNGLALCKARTDEDAEALWNIDRSSTYFELRAEYKNSSDRAIEMLTAIAHFLIETGYHTNPPAGLAANE